MHKLTLFIGVGIGYILGAKAGRERYEQLADQASKAWADPRVQSKIEEVKEQAPVIASKVKEQAPVLAGKVKDQATEGAHRVSDSVSRDGEKVDSEGSYENATGFTADGEPQVDDSGFGPGGDKLP